MYLHLGQETLVLQRSIIGIFDLETATVSRLTRDYLKKAQQSGRVINVTNELPKTFVVCGESGNFQQDRVYISQISSSTLMKRMRFLDDFAKPSRRDWNKGN